VGNIKASGTICDGSGNCIGSGGTGADTDWTISGSNIYRSSGMVGIGTNSPEEELDVVGDLRVASNTQTSSLDVVNGLSVGGTLNSKDITVNDELQTEKLIIGDKELFFEGNKLCYMGTGSCIWEDAQCYKTKYATVHTYESSYDCEASLQSNYATFESQCRAFCTGVACQGNSAEMSGCIGDDPSIPNSVSYTYNNIYCAGYDPDTPQYPPVQLEGESDVETSGISFEPWDPEAPQAVYCSCRGIGAYEQEVGNEKRCMTFTVSS
ncbi:MAG: hypothetical protein JW754_00590, partial [Candidatus Aenigmarchaeota archaeon]|nr:hypothetical protein [Candidatus Aenigmarchaeota archaeon]